MKIDSVNLMELANMNPPAWPVLIIIFQICLLAFIRKQLPACDYDFIIINKDAINDGKYWTCFKTNMKRLSFKSIFNKI